MNISMDGYEDFKLGNHKNPWVGINGLKAVEWQRGYEIAKDAQRVKFNSGNINYNCDAGIIPAFANED